MTEVAGNTVVDGRYRVLRRLGSGGMADVYCAEDTHLGRQVALKVLHRRFAQDQEFVERFRREAKSAAGLEPPQRGRRVRPRRARGHLLHRDGVPRGPHPQGHRPAEAPLPQERVIDLGPPDPPGGRVRAQPRGHPPRLQAAQRDRRRRRSRQGHRLRHRAGGRVGDDGDRLDHGHRAVPVARAGAGPRGHGHLGRLLDRRDALRDARRPAAVRGRQRGGDRAQAPVRAARADLAVAAGRASGARGRGHGGAREGPGAPLAVRGGPRRRASRPRAPRSRPASNGGQDTADFAAIPMPVADETGPRSWRRHATSGGRVPSASASGAGPGTRSARSPWRWSACSLYLILSGVLATDKKQVPRVTGKQLVEARAVMERAGFEVADRARAERAAVRPGARPGPERGRGGRRGLDGHARGLGRAGRGARAAGRAADRGPGRARAAEGGPQGDHRSGVLRQGEEGLRDPDRAEGGLLGHQGHARPAAGEPGARAGDRPGRDRPVAGLGGVAPARRAPGGAG